MSRDRFRNEFNWHAIAIVFLLWTAVSARTDGGLIFSGLDTLNSGRGFDFVLQRACTSSSDNSCFYHFNFFWDGSYHAYFAQINGQGLMLDLGKLNLDSIKSAPPDSVMKDDLGLGQPYMFFKIAPDSLSKCIGNVYLLKTGIDPRPAWNNAFYAKIRILKFIVVDSASHSIKMVFLWACQMSGTGDLHTSGLDTFHLDGTSTLPHGNAPAPHVAFSSRNQHVFKVVGDLFTVPKELFGSGGSVTVFDLSGRKLGMVTIGRERSVDLRGYAAGNRVKVVWVEKRF